jgi:hypothetical protein
MPHHWHYSYFEVKTEANLTRLVLRDKRRTFCSIEYEIDSPQNTIYVHDVAYDTYDHLRMTIEFFVESFRDYNIIARSSLDAELHDHAFEPIRLCGERFMIRYHD